MAYIHVKHQEKNHSISNTSTPNHHAQLISAMSVSFLNSQTTAKLPSVRKEYICFQIDGKTSQEAKCVKSRIITKVIDSFL